jgi:uncharacterized protein
MGFQYDPTKAALNLKKHGVSFSDAEGVFYDPLAIYLPDPDAEGEERFRRSLFNTTAPAFRCC